MSVAGPDEWILRELSRAQMIVSSPPGTWPQSLVALSQAVLRQRAGWNVFSLPTTRVATPRSAQVYGPAGAFLGGWGVDGG